MKSRILEEPIEVRHPDLFVPCECHSEFDCILRTEDGTVEVIGSAHVQIPKGRGDFSPLDRQPIGGDLSKLKFLVPKNGEGKYVVSGLTRCSAQPLERLDIHYHFNIEKA